MTMFLTLFISAAAALPVQFPDASTEHDVAKACGGYENLSSLAAPHVNATASEILLLWSGLLPQLEVVAPHLLWLRRGPLYAEDDRGGSVQLSPSRLPGASFTHTTTYKLWHDIEQFEYLASRGWRTHWLRNVVVPGYREVLRRASKSNQKPFYELDPLDLALIGSTYNRALLFSDTAWLPIERQKDSLLSDKVSWNQVDSRYDRLNVVYVDDALTPRALEALLEYAKSATVFFETKAYGAGGHMGAYLFDGFSAPLLFQLAEEIARAMPRTIGSHRPLRNMWAYKYSYSNSGIFVHKDQAAVQANLWISPDSANLDAIKSGGLKIYDDQGALKMERSMTPPELMGESGNKILDKLPNVTIPFRQNRLTFFDSALPHASDVGLWKEGYENRRISITFLFGEPSSPD